MPNKVLGEITMSFPPNLNGCSILEWRSTCFIPILYNVINTTNYLSMLVLLKLIHTSKGATVGYENIEYFNYVNDEKIA